MGSLTSGTRYQRLITLPESVRDMDRGIRRGSDGAQLVSILDELAGELNLAAATEGGRGSYQAPERVMEAGRRSRRGQRVDL